MKDRIGFVEERPDGGFAVEDDGPVLQGPTLRNVRRKFALHWPFSFLASSAYKTMFHSLFYEYPVVLSPGDPQYYEMRKKTDGF